MAIKTLKEFAIEGRKGKGTGTISEMRAMIGRLRAENMVLAKAVTGSPDCGGLSPPQVAGILMCQSVEVDAGEIETETGMIVKADVGVDDESFDVFVKLSFEGVKDNEPDDEPCKEDPPCEKDPPLDVDFEKEENSTPLERPTHSSLDNLL